MFSRVPICKNLWKISRQVLVMRHNELVPKNTTVFTNRHLHVKTYDKDTLLGNQRAKGKVTEMDIESDLNVLTRNSIEENNDKEKICFNRKQDSEAVQISSDTINGNPDTFGNASEEPVEEYEGDLQEEEYISRPTRRWQKLEVIEYAMMIKEHVKNHRLKEAIDILETRMLKEDRAKPDRYIFNLLISGCAKAGYTRKAFQLYTKMRQHGLKAKESTYTSLFNACANAPFRQDGLTRAIRLRESLLEKGIECNEMNYNAMIKAFGRWGDVKTSYILADEMRDKRLQLTGETFNFLLQACASDEKHGFRHCLLTWHQMLKKKIEPDYYSFNAVLRCVRDCGFGDLKDMENVLHQILNVEQIKSKAENNSGSNIEHSISGTLNPSASSNSLQISNESTNLQLPNLLADVPHLGSMISLTEIQKPHDRFLLLGGITGFLELMKARKITPNIQTFTTMLEVIPPTNVAEKQLLRYIRKIGLKADVDFFNILIKKRAMRFDYEGGKEVLDMIRIVGLTPDIVTYGVLALGCTTAESSRELLEEMRGKSLRINAAILGAMLRQGCAQKNFPYVCEIMQISLDENITPNNIFLTHLHKFHLQCARAIDSRHPSTKTKKFKKEHKKFCDKYRLYQQEHKIDSLKLEDAIAKIKGRPYEQYKEDAVEGMEPLKNENLSRKQKTRKYIKKIKLQNLKEDDNPTQDDVKLPYYSSPKTDVEENVNKEF